MTQLGPKITQPDATSYPMISPCPPEVPMRFTWPSSMTTTPSPTATFAMTQLLNTACASEITVHQGRQAIVKESKGWVNPTDGDGPIHEMDACPGHQGHQFFFRSSRLFPYSHSPLLQSAMDTVLHFGLCTTSLS